MDAVQWTAVRVSLPQAVDAALVDGHGLAAVSPATARWLRASVRRLVAYLGFEPEVDRLSPREVDGWVRYEASRGNSAVYVNSLLRALKTLYSRLQVNGIVGSNPAGPVRFVAEPRPSPKGVLEEDYRAMWAAAADGRDRAMLAVLWESGCRLGGLLSLRVDRMERWTAAGGWEQFALMAVEKGDRPRMVYVGRSRAESEALSAWLSDRPSLGPPDVFLAYDVPLRPLSAVSAQYRLRWMKSAAGIPRSRRCNAHAFRHAFAQRMLDEGKDLAAVSAWLGHASPEFTAKVYAQRPEWALRARFFEA